MEIPLSDADPLSWEARFREEYSELYPAVKEIAKPFVGKDAIAIMPSLYRQPAFWKDLCADLDNIRGLPDDGKLLRVVEKLLNGDEPDGVQSVRSFTESRFVRAAENQAVKDLIDSFWTLLTVLLNLSTTNAGLLFLVLWHKPSLLDFVDDEAFNKLVVILRTETLFLGGLSEESFLYMLNSKRMSVSLQNRRMMLYYSCCGGYTTVLSPLLDSLGSNDGDGINYVSTASMRGHVEIVKLLLKCESLDSEADGSEALSYAAGMGSTELMKLLLEDGRADPTQFTGVWMNWVPEIVSLLLVDGRIDPSENESQAFRFSITLAKAELVKLLLLDGRSDPCVHDNAALRSASYDGHVDIVRLILEDGRVDGPALNNALIIASEMGHTDIVLLLLGDAKVDSTAKNNRAVWAAS